MFSSLDSYSHKEDASAFPGKRALISFLSWFDYCDQLIKEAQKVWNVYRWYEYIQQISSSSCFLAFEFEFETYHFVLLFQTAAVAMAKAVRERFFIDVMEPQLMQTWVASYKTQQNRIWIKLIFFQIKSTSYLTWNFLFSSEIGILTSTALLHRIVRQVTSDVLLQEIVYFILGEHREPETLADINRHPLRHRLIEHCDHISDEVRSGNDIIMSAGQFCLA